MKLWEIKAQSLRMMFADTDINFSEEEFSNGSIYDNANTREKLIRMEDSIKRAIDTYYQYVGEQTKIGDFSLYNTTNDLDETVYSNYIDMENVDLFGYPARIDAYIYETVTDVEDNEYTQLRKVIKEIDYTYDQLSKKIYFFEQDYTSYQSDITFKIWYKTNKINIPYTTDEMTYDLNDIYIPEEVQRMIPYYVKGELYEEDEPNIALNSKYEYIKFLTGLKKPFSKVQTKVKRASVFDK